MFWPRVDKEEELVGEGGQGWPACLPRSWGTARSLQLVTRVAVGQGLTPGLQLPRPGQAWLHSGPGGTTCGLQGGYPGENRQGNQCDFC